MELLGYLTFVGDLQTLQPRSNSNSSQYGNEPLMVRDICVHTFVPMSKDGVLTPLLRAFPLRLMGRQAQTFAIPLKELVTVEYGTSARPYFDEKGQAWRVNGNLSVLRICQVLPDDLERLSRASDDMNNHQTL